MQDIIKTVNTIRENIENHRNVLEKNEMATRYALVDPLLRVLGWDTGNPAIVRPEFAPKGDRADYALYSDKDTLLYVVEVKSLGTPMDRNVKVQVGRYWSAHKSNYIIVTNGYLWQILDHNLNEIESFNISDADAPRRSTIIYNDGVHKIRAQKRIKTGTDDLPDVLPADYTYTPITEIKPKKGDKSPTRIKFPDDTKKDITSWVGVLYRIAEWIITNNRTDIESQLPIISSRRHLVSSEPVHPNGGTFRSKKEIAGLFLECNYGPKDCLKNAIDLVNIINKDPQTIMISFGDQTHSTNIEEYQ